MLQVEVQSLGMEIGRAAAEPDGQALRQSPVEAPVRDPDGLQPGLAYVYIYIYIYYRERDTCVCVCMYVCR